MSMSDPLNHLGSIWYHSKHLEVPYSPNQFIVVRFASFLSGGFIIAIVVNPPERKLSKRTSVRCSGVKVCIEYYKICLKLGPTVLYKHSVASEMAATQNEDPHFNF